MKTKTNRSGVLLAILVLTVAPGPTRATELNATDEVRVITYDAEGREHSRIVWWAELDGTIYIRTTPLATWGRNLRRQGSARLVFAHQEVPVSAEVVEDPSKLERIHAAFRAKYGPRDFRADIVRFFAGGKITLATTPLENGAASTCGGHATSTDRPQEKG